MSLATVGGLQLFLILSDTLFQYAVSSQMILCALQAFDAGIAIADRVSPDLTFMALDNLFCIYEPLPPYNHIFHRPYLCLDVAEASFAVRDDYIQ
jgi:hypothetical protein